MSKKKAAWTVMVYLAGDNNLTTECLFALTEMKKAAPGKQIHVIAQFDPRDEYLPTHRYEINRKGPNSTLFEDIIDEARYNPETGEVRFRRESTNADSLGASRFKRRQAVKSILSDASDLTSLEFKDENVTDDTDTGSPVTLYNFLSFCIQEYPAHHYMVVLSGHAGGTESDYLLKDESTKGSLTFNELKEVFKELQTDLNGRPVAIVGMDNCLMSMGEVCYELKGLSQVVVGCESYSPASGWPYRQILERFRKDFAVATLPKKRKVEVEAAKAIVEEYVEYYSSYWMAGMSVAQSALDLRCVDKLKSLVDKLATVMESELKKEYQKNRGGKQGRKRSQPFRDSLIMAHWEAQSYNGEWFVDLYDFCDCLEKRLHSGAVARRCRELKLFLGEEFVLKSCYGGAAYQYSYGVSIYFPWSQVASKYKNLAFVKDSAGLGWLRFLQTYTQLTRREPRGIDKDVGIIPVDATLAGNSRMMSDRMMSDRMMSDRMMSDRMMSDRMMSDRMMSDRMMSDRMMSDRMMSDRMMSDRMMSNVGGNPIHSMRNPPVFFVPPKCIREHKKVLLGLEKLFGEDG